ncbi:Serine/threonine-protein kinase PknD [Paraburkholderia aspalathi]|uniref:AAA family ATPase n=1 Tax=Paraburkholderia aspalathi TaxID=1324617 RepID=UPI00190A5A8E|nr:AAA family ATPase [Paraburkholderia aspalathi]MBK3844141.1 AAA family ATPase [Paraburkholderia aspalathi]CAE6867946.1 Serine/threonine-protein kinase PknD [Paraburkholderia aspalathi]
MDSSAQLGVRGDCSSQLSWEDGERAFCQTWWTRADGRQTAVLAVRPALEHPTRASLDRLVHEYGLKDELESAWAARPLELVREGGRLLLLLEDHGGEPLSRLLGAPTEVGRFLRLAIGIVAALSKAHQRGLVHKDVKPANILVNANEDVRLTGFGIASRLPRERQAPEAPEAIAGTFAYMAPEQTGRMNRSVDARSDLYAFGVTLYQMLTGALPFEAAYPMEWVHCHIARKPVPPRERVGNVPAPVSAIVMRLLAKMPEERYQTAGGVEHDLRRCLNGWEAQGDIEDFPVGQQDTPDRLLIPEKLYGRADEVETLLASFDRIVKSGAPEMVLVSGYAGIGKSSLVNELHRVLVPSRGLFAAGKFDQYKRDIPYSTLAQAFQGIVRPLLGKSDTELAAWRDALSDALGPNGRLIVDVVPELKFVVGEQPPVPELPPHDAQRRFQLVLRRFIGVFARAEHPLALFLDDLQWLDAATLDLLEDLLTGSDLQHLMLIGAYRDNEVKPAHPLMRKLKSIKAAGGKVVEIALAPLAEERLRQLVADALRCEPARAAPLAQVVYEKSGGNPFFAIQFLSSLADAGMLSFRHDAVCWFWDIDRIHATGYTDNVVDLMVAKLTRLPRETQKALRQLACLGNVAETATLSIVLGVPERQTHAVLWPAVRQVLVERLEGAYRFVHDRVQEAVYSLIDDERRGKAHLQIGRLLANRTPPGKREAAIFEIVNQLNRANHLITSVVERERLAEFNLIAGRRARISTAYAAALRYLVAGAALGGNDGWERRHDLFFALELNRAECEFLTGALAVANVRLEALSTRATDAVEKASVTCLRLDLYVAAGQSGRGVAVGLEYLRHLGVEWSAHPTEEEALREYERIRSVLGDRPIETLVELPLMSAPASLASLDVLARLAVPAFYTDLNLFFLVICRIVNLSLEGGNADASCVAYEWLGGTIAGLRFGDVDTGFQFGRLGYDLVEQRGLKRFQARTYMIFGNTILPWKSHVRSGRELVHRAFKAANQSGDVNFAAYCCNQLNTNLLAAGDSLDEVQGEAERGLAFAEKMRVDIAVSSIGPQLGLIRTLRGLTSNFGCFDDAQLDEHAIERRFSDNPDLAQAECRYWIRKLQARYFAGDYAAAVDASSIAQRLLWTLPSHFETAEYYFYGALSRAALCDSASANQRQQHVEALAVLHRQLESWAVNCPENFENRAALVGAEIARIEGRALDAEVLYEQAIHSAQANGFVHNEALANEVAARFYAARGLQRFAQFCLRNARYGYLRWGATGKVRQLDEQYPHIRGEERAPDPTSTIGTPVEHLDLVTVMKVSQAVSSEIVLDNLIDTLMCTAIEQAGAERGVLLLFKGGALRIQAQAITQGNAVKVQACDDPLTAMALPAIVFHALRTREAVIVNDARADSAFSTDPYIVARQARSILCVPLINQANVIGALYLENNLASAVFVPARAAVLKLVASQAAITLENARLYRELAEREAKIRRLVDANIIGIFFWRLEGETPESSDSVVYEVNDSFLRMLGYDRDDFASGRLSRSNLTPPEWRERTAEAHAELMRVGTFQPYEKEYLRKDGTRVPALIGTAAFEGGNQGVAFVLDLTDLKEAEHRLRESYDMLRELTSRRETAREEERKRVARELHDELGQHLTALRMRASALRMKFGNDRPELVGEIRALIGLMDGTMQVAREVIASLRPPALDMGIAAALEWLATEFNRNGCTVCRVRLEDENIVVSEDCAIALFRLVQEALTNVTRHAAAKQVIISLGRMPDACVLEVRDDGRGFDALAPPHNSFGLVGMRERVLMLGGQIDIVSSPGTGTAIKVSLPDGRTEPHVCPPSGSN